MASPAHYRPSQSSLSACSPSHSLSATFSRSSVTEETTILPESTHSSDPETVSREESNSITKTEESESTTSLAVDGENV